MPGTIMSLGLSQQMDLNGRPVPGCRLELYVALSTTKVTAYKTIALSGGEELPWPITADANGRLPAFWLPDGSYRARLTEPNGSVMFDEQNLPSIGPPGTDVPPVITVPAEELMKTGDVKWRPINDLLPGWVRLNGKTLGLETTGTEEDFGPTCKALYQYLWGKCIDAVCPVAGGRGATSELDWNANKHMTLLDLRASAPFGLDGMGNSPAGGFNGNFIRPGGSGIIAGSKGGASVIGFLRSYLPIGAAGSIAVSIGAGQGSHNHTIKFQQRADVALTGTGGLSNLLGGGPDITPTVDNDSGSGGKTLPAMSGTAQLNPDASQTPMPMLPPFVLGTWFIRK
jgi:hypothetical protein